MGETCSRKNTKSAALPVLHDASCNFYIEKLIDRLKGNERFVENGNAAYRSVNVSVLNCYVFWSSVIKARCAHLVYDVGIMKCSCLYAITNISVEMIVININIVKLILILSRLMHEINLIIHPIS